MNESPTPQSCARGSTRPLSEVSIGGLTLAAHVWRAGIVDVALSWERDRLVVEGDDGAIVHSELAFGEGSS